MGKCVICGKPSGMYPLCAKHSKMIKTGEVAKDKDGKWVLTNIESNMGHSSCIICGAESQGKPLCHDCWKKASDKEDEIDKNSQTPSSLKTYYFNLKSSIYRMTGMPFIKSNTLKLFSISYYLSDVFSDDSLSSRVADDASDIMEKKRETKIPVSPETIKQDMQMSGQMRTEDGHMVKSVGEQAVDNCLFHSGWVHVYEKKVSQICGEDDRAVFCDFSYHKAR